MGGVGGRWGDQHGAAGTDIGILAYWTLYRPPAGPGGPPDALSTAPPRHFFWCPGRATVPRITAPHTLPSAVATASAPAISRISWLNPTPQTITVYASPVVVTFHDATLVTGQALPLSRTGLSPAGPRQLRLAHRYAFTVRDSHPLLLAGLPAHIGFVLPNPRSVDSRGAAPVEFRRRVIRISFIISRLRPTKSLCREVYVVGPDAAYAESVRLL